MNYTITITDEERAALGKLLKRAIDLLANAKPLLSSTDAASGEVASGAIPQDAERHILWASGKVDSESTPLTVRISKFTPGTTKQNSPCMYVSWGQPGAQYMATAFDTNLFEPIKAAQRENRPVRFYLRKRGQYQNIVGILINGEQPRA